MWFAYLFLCISIIIITVESNQHRFSDKPVNIIIILADDLGYGDTSVHPFVGSNILTPYLEKMASRGTLMSNFHTAAAVCTPTRASILTGLFPWRLGIKGVYEYGQKNKSNRDDWLPQISTLATIFREANYTTAHSGKWHVGGMRNDDLDMRRLPDYGSNTTLGYYPGGKRCPHPGPNQQGFQQYISVLDGPGAPRQNHLQVNAVLYSEGCNYLLKNDKPFNRGQPKEYLFDCEVRNAIAMMKQSIDQNKPFFIQLWFHAPHGPWEIIPEYQSMYQEDYKLKMDRCKRNTSIEVCKQIYPYRQPNSQFDMYRTMISGMDNSIGTLLTALKTMNIERDTLVVFLSDNGPEDNVGTSATNPVTTLAGLRGNKRFLYEGGIRVPCIWQWIGKQSRALGISTDLFPTLLEAASIEVPHYIKLDGISLLPELLRQHRPNKRMRRIFIERMGLWHAEYEGPRSTAAILFNFKVKLDQNDHPMEIFDLQNDMNEKNNLIPDLEKLSIDTILSWRREAVNQLVGKSSLDAVALNMVANTQDRRDPWLHKLIVSKAYWIMDDFAKYGNKAHQQYLKENPGRYYKMTVESDTRHALTSPYKTMTQQQAQAYKNQLLNGGFCSTPCGCDLPSSSNVLSLPFNRTYIPSEANAYHAMQYLIPHGFINATEVLFGNGYKLYRLS